MDNIFSMYRFGVIPNQEKFIDQFIEYLKTNFFNQNISFKITNKLEENGSLISLFQGKVDNQYNEQLSSYINSILPRNNSFYDSKKLSFLNNGDYCLLKDSLIDHSQEYKDYQKEVLYNKLDSKILSKDNPTPNKVKI